MKTGQIAKDLLEELRQLEESLWRSESRYDDVAMQQLFATDFTEFGRSGQRYVRAQMFVGDAPASPIFAQLPLPDFEARWISEDTVLITYISEVTRSTGIERANRSSIWSRDHKTWHLRFHQGTPIPSAESQGT